MTETASVLVTLVLAVVTGGALFLILALGSRRLLGLQLGAMRTILAGIVGMAAWLGFAATIQRPIDRPLVLVALTTVQFGAALLAGMLFLILAEAVVPSGSLRPLAWWRASRFLATTTGRRVSGPETRPSGTSCTGCGGSSSSESAGG